MTAPTDPKAPPVQPAAAAPAVPAAAPPERFNFAQHLLRANAGRPDKAAFIDDRGTLRYGTLDARVRQMAAALRSLGVKREERVLLLMQDCNDWPVSFLGAVHAGIVPVAVNTLLTADDYAYMLQNTRARRRCWCRARCCRRWLRRWSRRDHEVQQVIVSHPVAPLQPGEVEFEAFLQRPPAAGVPGRWHRRRRSRLLALFVGLHRPPQGHRAHACQCLLDVRALRQGGAGSERGRRLLFGTAKLFFAYGLGNALTFPLSVGATTLLMAERPTPEATFQRWTGADAGLGRPKPTVFFGAPTGFAGMLASPQLPPAAATALRLVSSAGEALPAEIGERFKRHFGVDIVDGIGSTEMLHIFISNRPERVRYGSTGWPVPGYAVQLRGDDGQPVPDGEPGDLYIQGPSAALMYWGNREKTRDTFQGGWTKSGDKYIRNSDGSYTYGGRSDDMLKVSGIYVSPFEVEATLVQHPAVLEAAVIGVPDVQGLTKTKAFVVLKAGAAATEAELKAFVKDRLAPYKYPRAIAFVADLPKTATGKIQRFKLRDMEALQRAGAIDPPAAPSAGATAEPAPRRDA